MIFTCPNFTTYKDRTMKITQSIAISESGFVFNPSTGESFNVNNVGQRILMLLKNDISQEEISEVLINEFKSDRLTIEKDLQEFLSMLTQFQLLEK